MNQFLILEFLYKGPLSKLSFFMGINGKKRHLMDGIFKPYMVLWYTT